MEQQFFRPIEERRLIVKLFSGIDNVVSRALGSARLLWPRNSYTGLRLASCPFALRTVSASKVMEARKPTVRCSMRRDGLESITMVLVEIRRGRSLYLRLELARRIVDNCAEVLGLDYLSVARRAH
jgi:hypothetical protein